MKKNKRIKGLMVIAISCFYFSAGAQNIPMFTRAKSLVIHNNNGFLKKAGPLPVSSFPLSFPLIIPQQPSVSAMQLAPDYYTRNWGYFCKLEWATRKSLKIPLSFRLGDLEYEEHLEGKQE